MTIADIRWGVFRLRALPLRQTMAVVSIAATVRLLEGPLAFDLIRHCEGSMKQWLPRAFMSAWGGVYSIATVMDDFIDRIMVDPRLNAIPRVDEAHHRVPPAGFKYIVTEMVCWATGGPQKYTGRCMKDSHIDLMITAAEWEAVSRRSPTNP